MTTPSSSVRMFIPLRMAQSEAKSIARMKFGRVKRASGVRAEERPPLREPGLVLTRDAGSHLDPVEVSQHPVTVLSVAPVSELRQ